MGCSHRDDGSESTGAAPGTITQLLDEWEAVRSDAVLERLLPLVYEELRIVARRYAQPDRLDLQPTELVSEAFLRIAKSEDGWRNRKHFYAAAALTMRRILVNHARDKKRIKRGGDTVHVPIDERSTSAAVSRNSATSFEILDLNQALETLGEGSRRKQQILEMHFFAGLEIEEIGEVMGISARTVQRDLRFGKAWLSKELTG